MSDCGLPANVGPMEGLGRTPRLWVVRLVREAYVLADSEDDALDAQREIERWESLAVTATPAGKQRLRGWDDGTESCLVYGTDKDITLAAARLMVAVA